MCVREYCEMTPQQHYDVPQVRAVYILPETEHLKWRIPDDLYCRNKVVPYTLEAVVTIYSRLQATEQLFGLLLPASNALQPLQTA